MIRILSIVIQDYPSTGMVYGAERSFIDLANNMRELGADVSTIEGFPSFGRFIPIDYRSFEVKHSPFFIARVALQAFRVARRLKCNVIYAYHSDHAYSVIPAYLVSILTRKALFVGVLDDRLQSEDGQSISMLLSIALQNERKLRKSLRTFSFKLIRRFACKWASCFTPTKHVARYAINYLHARNVFVIGRGVNDVWFSGEMQEKTHKYDGSYLGRIDPMKGLYTLFDSWKEVVKKRPDANLLIVGDAWPGLLPTYLKKIDDLGIKENVIFTGYISKEESIRKLLRSSEVFVFPSKLEGFSRAVIEAMACGLPCVLGDIPTAREVFGKAAVFVPPDDNIQISRAILNLLNDEEKRARIGRNASEFARQFSWQVVANRALRSIDSILSN